MTPTLSLCTVLSLLLLTSSTPAHSQEKRYLNFHHATHISGGWVAFSNGSLYACQFSKEPRQQAPTCVEAVGLPSRMQSVSTLWGERNSAWVAYSDGRVYGCHYSMTPVDSEPRCLPASGLP